MYKGQEQDKKYGAEAIALITSGDTTGLRKLLETKPVEVRMAFNTGGQKPERLDEYAARIGNTEAVKLLKKAGAPAI